MAGAGAARLHEVLVPGGVDRGIKRLAGDFAFQLRPKGAEVDD